jgi:hypothetical protein
MPLAVVAKIEVRSIRVALPDNRGHRATPPRLVGNPDYPGVDH